MKRLLFFFTAFVLFSAFCFTAAAQDSGNAGTSDIQIDDLDKTPIQIKGERNPYLKIYEENLFVNRFVTLLLIAAVVYIILLGIKKIFPAFLGPSISSKGFGVSRLVSLNGKNHLSLVRFGSKLLLLGVSGDKTVKLAETSDPKEIEIIINDFTSTK